VQFEFRRGGATPMTPSGGTWTDRRPERYRALSGLSCNLALEGDLWPSGDRRGNDRKTGQNFDLFPEYAKAVYHRWNDYFFEPLLLSPVVLWWMLGSPPVWLVTWAFVIALVVAGYYTWRADHLRLLPKLEFAPGVFVEIHERMENNPIAYVQVLPRPVTEGPVEQCEGHLL
jgi:hypothetical protein